jgi:carotenoid cleavage dioxygenase
MKMRVLGIVKEKESGNPVPGLVVFAYDKDVLRNDLLGKTKTDSDGKFSIEYDSTDFKEPLERNPDIFVEVYRAKDIKASKKGRIKPIYTTRRNIRYRASSSEKYYIEIPKKKLEKS